MQRSFVYGNYIDEVLLMTDGGGNDHYYVHDHLYSPVALLDDTGGVQERYEYDAYGYVTMFDGSFTPITGSAASNPYYFTGRRLDIMDGGNYELMYYRNRTYNPQTGRFLQPDPMGYIDGMNLYEYVGSNPVMNLDPLGLALYAFDGTGNDRNAVAENEQAKQTNVVRLFDAYSARRHYYTGVGTYDNEPGGKAFGQGGRRILEEAYAQLVANFERGDTEIDIIGFSRGAAMAREFANMINSRGDPLGEANKVYKGRKVPKGACKSSGKGPKIRFLGIFDTVGSFGVPGNKADVGYDFSIPDNVEAVRHAVSQHERRKGFELTSALPYEGYIDRTGRIQEKAYPGAHSDIGGGYSDNFLAGAPLWHMAVAGRRLGVPFSLRRIRQMPIQPNINGTGIHNSNVFGWSWGRAHPIMSPKEVKKIEMEDRKTYYYGESKKRLRR